MSTTSGRSLGRPSRAASALAYWLTHRKPSARLITRARVPRSCSLSSTMETVMGMEKGVVAGGRSRGSESSLVGPAAPSGARGSPVRAGRDRSCRRRPPCACACCAGRCWPFAGIRRPARPRPLSSISSAKRSGSRRSRSQTAEAWACLTTLLTASLAARKTLWRTSGGYGVAGSCAGTSSR